METKLIQAIPGMPQPVTVPEVESFLLESKLNMQLATLDKEGYPTIQPIWFYFDKESGKLYTGTQRETLKVQNIKRNPDKLYFSIDDESYPYKGVKGRGKAIISEDKESNVSIIEKINLKYLGTLDHPLAKRLLENTRNGTEIVIEITPTYFSAWDFRKAQ